MTLPPSTIELPERFAKNQPGMVQLPPMNRTYCRYCIYSFCICQPLGSNSFHNTAYQINAILGFIPIQINACLGSISPQITPPLGSTAQQLSPHHLSAPFQNKSQHPSASRHRTSQHTTTHPSASFHSTASHVMSRLQVTAQHLMSCLGFISAHVITCHVKPRLLEGKASYLCDITNCVSTPSLRSLCSHTMYRTVFQYAFNMFYRDNIFYLLGISGIV